MKIASNIHSTTKMSLISIYCMFSSEKYMYVFDRLELRIDTKLDIACIRRLIIICPSGIRLW